VQIGPELVDQYRNAFGAPPAVTQRILDRHFRRPAAVGEEDLQRVGDRTLARVEIVEPKTSAPRSPPSWTATGRCGIRRRVVLVVGGRQAAPQQRDGDHVLQAVVAVGWIVQWAPLVDDAQRRLVRADEHAFDRLPPPGDLRLQLESALDRRLGVELGRKLILKSMFSMT
jgi:hypothetical protein